MLTRITASELAEWAVYLKIDAEDRERAAADVEERRRKGGWS
jgi:hypothetical protein